jgi:hypothetical protein
MPVAYSKRDRFLRPATLATPSAASLSSSSHLPPAVGFLLLNPIVLCSPMSGQGQKQTSRHVRVMSVIRLKADIH